MEATVTDPDKTAELLAKIFRADLEIGDSLYKYRFLPDRDENISVYLERSRMERIFEKSYEEKKSSSTILYDEEEYEVLVQSENVFRSILSRKDGEIESHDTTNSLEYEVSRPSNKYIVYLINIIEEEAKVEFLRRYISATPSGILDIINQEDEPDDRDLFQISRELSLGIYTLKIRSEDQRYLSEFNDLADSYMFELSYSFNSALVVKRDVEEVIGSGVYTNPLRGDVKNIEPPKRYYENDLIYHYQMGVSSRTPSQKYLSFYHVTEHFFDSVFEEDLIEELKDTITKPDFSYRSDSDVRSIVEKVSKRLKAEDQKITYSEKEALKLTLKKHIELDRVKSDVSKVSENLVDFYKSNEVDFASAPAVNLLNDDEEQELATIATRVYNTRNSIVHSKGRHEDRYIPFKHDNQLVKEIPLIRSIAESLIISASQMIPE